MPIAGLHLREGERVLAFLALYHGGVFPYRALAERFWPDEARVNTGDGGGFPSTRQGIRSLRVALGSEAYRVRTPEKGSIQLDLSGADVDLLEFDRLARLSTPAAWQEAVERYRGPLLAGWTDAWIRTARDARKRVYEQLLRRLVDEARLRGDTAADERWLRLWLASDSLNEEACRGLMRLWLNQGRLAEAREAFEAVAARLRQAGRQPEAETAGLDAEIRRARELVPVAAHIPSQVPAAAPGQTVALLYRRKAEPDEHVVSLLESWLTAAGYRVFVDRNMQGGVDWMRELECQLQSAYAVVPIISAASAESEMLEFEVETAHRAAQLQGGLPRLLPVRCAYEAPLSEERRLGILLNPLQYLLWRNAADDKVLAGTLLRALASHATELPEVDSAGGAVRLDSQFYIVRPTDEIFHSALKRGESTLLIKGARQMGKTSLLARGLERARQAGIRVALTDMQSFSERKLESAEALLYAFAATIAEQLELDASPRRDWDDDFDPGANLERFLRKRVLLPDLPPLIWAMDEVDRLFHCPFRSDIFGLFRSWHNRRALDPRSPWSRLTLAIAYATEAHLFITDVNQSPFNVGTRIALEDFTLAETAELNRRYGSPLKSQTEIASFYALLNGHPYLSRRGLDEMVSRGAGLAQLEAEGALDEGPFGDHLRRLLAILSQDSALIQALLAVLNGQPFPSPEIFYRLRSAGLVSGRALEEARPRCRLYADYFTRRLI